MTKSILYRAVPGARATRSRQQKPTNATSYHCTNNRLVTCPVLTTPTGALRSEHRRLCSDLLYEKPQECHLQGAFFMFCVARGIVLKVRVEEGGTVRLSVVFDSIDIRYQKRIR